MPFFSKKEREREEKIFFLRRQEEERIARMVAESFNLPYINLLGVPIEIDALSLVPEEIAREGLFAPFSKLNKNLQVFCVDPKNELLKKTLKELEDEGFKINLFVGSKTSFEKILKAYQKLPPLQKKIVGKIEIRPERLKRIQEEIQNIKDLQDKLEQGRKLASRDIIEILLASSLKLNASDIHIVPQDKNVRLRYRIDGIMHTIFFFDRSVYDSLLSKIKILSSLKINVHDVAQDGRFSILAEGKEVEVRVSVVPGEYGEDIVMRILNPKMILSIEKIGLHPWLEEVLRYQMNKPNGMILVCGPTGSGKTTTLYACLKEKAKSQLKVITIENPIEYHLKGIAQTQVNPEKGYDFADGLRAALRQDPDVILVGEIRDRATAETAVQAALTGHLVFSTIHTNDAAGAVPRLIEMGVSPNGIASALNLAISQRLVRRLCPYCKKKYTPSPEVLEKIKRNLKDVIKRIPDKFDLDNIEIFKAQGCPKCSNIGYKGRIGIFEMFEVSQKIKEIISSFPSTSKMREAAIEEGMITIQQDGLLRVLEGQTSLEEVERITGPLK